MITAAWKTMKSKVRETQRYLDLKAVHMKFSDFTMVPRMQYITSLKLSQSVAAVPGCVIECGVWRGGMIAGIADILGPERLYVLFDSFEGLPPAREINGPVALAWQSDKESPTYHNNAAAPQEYCEEAMRRSRAAHVQIMKGWFEETIPKFQPPEPIALLRLDSDWFDSTMICLKHLASHMHEKGIIIVDDYYAFEGCSRAIHQFLAARQDTLRVQQADNLVCYLSH